MSELINSIVITATECMTQSIEYSLCKRCPWEEGLECKLCVLNPTHIPSNKPNINTTLNILINRKQP